MNSLVRRQEVFAVDDFTSHVLLCQAFFYAPRIFRQSRLEIFARACGARGGILVEFVAGFKPIGIKLRKVGKTDSL